MSRSITLQWLFRDLLNFLYYWIERVEQFRRPEIKRVENVKPVLYQGLRFRHRFSGTNLQYALRDFRLKFKFDHSWLLNWVRVKNRRSLYYRIVFVGDSEPAERLSLIFSIPTNRKRMVMCTLNEPEIMPQKNRWDKRGHCQAREIRNYLTCRKS